MGEPLTLECVFSEDVDGNDVLARIAISGGDAFDVIRPIFVTMDSNVTELRIIYEVIRA